MQVVCIVYTQSFKNFELNPYWEQTPGGLSEDTMTTQKTKHTVS